MEEFLNKITDADIAELEMIMLSITPTGEQLDPRSLIQNAITALKLARNVIGQRVQMTQTVKTTLQLKADKKAEITGWRVTAETSGCETALGVMATDAPSMIKLLGAVQLAQMALANSDVYSVNWKMADGSIVTHDAAQIIAAGVVVGLHIQNCHDREAVLIAMVDAVDDDLEAGDAGAELGVIVWAEPVEQEPEPE